jgi:TadE-like protein
MTMNSASGQSLVEVALVLPVLLLLLAGSYVCCRATFLHSAAESAAQTEAIRAGRHLPGIEGKMSDGILPQGHGVVIRPESTGNVGTLPVPVPSLAGRTRGIVEIQEEREGISGFPDFPPLQVFRLSEASVDCWEKKSGSGKKIRNFTSVYVATGVLR